MRAQRRQKNECGETKKITEKQRSKNNLREK